MYCRCDGVDICKLYNTAQGFSIPKDTVVQVYNDQLINQLGDRQKKNQLC